jgi:hypothetical protein
MPLRRRAAPNAQRVVSVRTSSLFRTGCGARLDAAPPDLAHGIQGGLLGDRRRRPTETSPGPTDKPFVQLGRLRIGRDEGARLDLIE